MQASCRREEQAEDGAYQSLIEVNARIAILLSQSSKPEYQSLIEVNARTTDYILRLLYPQPLVMSSEQIVNKKR